MGYANYVGRVGALAVALGIGAAVATSAPGVAWAGPGGSNDGTSVDKEKPAPDSDSDSTKPPKPGDTLKKNLDRAADDLRHVISSVVTSSGGAIKSELRHAADVVKNPRAAAQSPIGTKPRVKDFLSDFTDGDSEPTVVKTDPPKFKVNLKTVEDLAAQRPTIKVLDKIKDAADESITAITGDRGMVPSQIAERKAISSFTAPPNDEVEDEAAPAIARAPLGVVSSVLSTALAPFFGANTPGQPQPQNPVLWAVLGWVRRQFDETPLGKIVDNRPPVVAGAPEIDSVDGTDHQVVDVHATDPDGDAVKTVSATDGAHGKTTVNADGTVTYDPADDFNGTDKFTVTVSDEASGFHLHGLAGLFGSTDGHTTTTEVTVDVQHELPIEGEVDKDGKVTTEVTLRDGVVADPRTLIGTKYPTQYGTAEITDYDDQTKKYTIVYTPDANIRVGSYAAAPAAPPTNTVRMFSARSSESLAAAAVGPPAYDTVSITVGVPPNQQTFAFQVPITPARLRTDTDAITVGDAPQAMVVDGNKLYVLNGGVYAGGSANTVTVIDTTTNKPVGTPIALSSDGSDIVASGGRVYVRTDDGVTVIDTATDTVVDMDPSTPDVVDSIHVPSRSLPAPGGMVIHDNKLYAMDNGHTITVVDLDSDRDGDVDADDTYTVENTPITVDGVQFSYGMAASGDKLYVTDFSGKSVHAISIAPGSSYGKQVGAPIQIGDTPSTIAASNSYVYVSTPLSGKVVVIDPNTNQVVGSVPTGVSSAGITSFAFSPDGSLLYVGGSDTVSVIDTATNQLVLTTVADGTPDPFPVFVAASSDNAHIYTSDQFKVFNSQTNNTLGVISFYVGDDETAPDVDPIANPTAASANPASGTVSTVVHATDVDGDALSVTVSRQPQHGTVGIAPGTNGNYTVTYTPDGQARLDAYSGTGPTTDQFVVTINDGQQSVSKVVDVPIDKADAAVTNTTAVSNSELVFPRHLAIDSAGDLFVTVFRADDALNLSEGHIALVSVKDGHVVDLYNPSEGPDLLGSVEDVAIDKNGVTYVADPTNNTVATFNGNTAGAAVDVHGEPIGLFTTPGGDVYAVVASQDENLQRVVSVYDVTNKAAVGVAYTRPGTDVDDGLTDATTTSDGRTYVTNPADGTVSVVGGATTTDPIDVGGVPISVAASGNRVFVVVSHRTGSFSTATSSLELVEVTDGTARHVADVYTSAPGQGSIAEGSDVAVRGNRVYVTKIADQTAGVPASGSILVFDADSGAQLDPISLGTNPFTAIPTRVVFGPAGDDHLYVLSAQGYVSTISFADDATNL